MSGTGKSTVVAELRRRGHLAFDADVDGFSEPREDGRWGWRMDSVADLLAAHPDELLFADLAAVEPLLRRSADVVITTTAPITQVADRILAAVDRGADPGLHGRDPAA
jgi:hypothetical protein